MTTAVPGNRFLMIALPSLAGYAAIGIMALLAWQGDEAAGVARLLPTYGLRKRY